MYPVLGSWNIQTTVETYIQTLYCTRQERSLLVIYAVCTEVVCTVYCSCGNSRVPGVVCVSLFGAFGLAHNVCTVCMQVFMCRRVVGEPPVPLFKSYTHTHTYIQIICIYIYIYVYTYLHYTCVYINMCMCMCMYAYIYIGLYLCRYIR